MSKLGGPFRGQKATGCTEGDGAMRCLRTGAAEVKTGRNVGKWAGMEIGRRE